MKSLSPSSSSSRPATWWIAPALAAALALSACAAPVTRTTQVYEAPGMPAPERAVAYGTVSRIEVIETEQHPTGGGAVLGALIGGVVGNQVGHGSGRAAATALGVFGGAVVGDQAERNQAAVNSGTIYRVIVQFDDGSARSFDYRSLDGLRAGERVRFENGLLNRA